MSRIYFQCASILLVLSLLLQAQHSPTADDLVNGERLFKLHCAACHGLKGEGGSGPTLAVPRQWSYRRTPPQDARGCCGAVNRGLAILDDTLFLGTFDVHLVALDQRTGKPRWGVIVADYKTGHTITVAPLAVKDKVIVGIAGGEFGIRGFLDASNAKTGERVWRLWTVPRPGEPGNETWEGESWKTGGAPTWVTGSYDPELNLIYWGTGNPGPDWNGDDREGDTLYSDSLLAIDADTGKWRRRTPDLLSGVTAKIAQFRV